MKNYIKDRAWQRYLDINIYELPVGLLIVDDNLGFKRYTREYFDVHYDLKNFKKLLSCANII